MPPPNDRPNEDYTVGWICAIHPEVLAARVCLDEIHGTPDYIAPKNVTNFTLGRIGKHNVVIACLPEGDYGIASATGVVKDMLYSFTNIRACLMVGIAGGAPTKDHDIRLGDIVVSVPGHNHGGVWQHDFGKEVQNQDFQRTGFLNKPAQILLGAVSSLKVEYKLDRSQPETAISLIIRGQDEELQEELRRPCQDSDRLFLSHVICPSPGSSSCEGTSPVDQSNLVEREQRRRPQCPIVHYGLIASGSGLIKDANFRDRHANDRGILCFEMEAAGLMNNFPCLIIRGICDYSDTHKNDEWQQYAALAAAVYAKDLLNQIAPTEVNQHPKIRLEEVFDKLSDVEQGINNLNNMQQIQENTAMLQWITTVDYSPQYCGFRDSSVDGTGQWLLDSKEYKTWLQSNRHTLFCTGKPGSGKTFLATKVISHLCKEFKGNSSIGIAYIYCQYKRGDDQKFRGLLASLLKQLAAACSRLPDDLRQLYESHQAKGTTLTLHEILKSLQAVAENFSRVFIVIDALDECQGENASLIKLVEYILRDLQVNTATNFFATSRGLPNIQELFQDFPRLEIWAKRDDIERYVDAHMKELIIFESGQEYPDLQRSIKDGISRAVEGMFLLAKFYFDLLKNKYNEADIYDALAKLEMPSNLGANEDQGRLTYKKVYDELMNRIKGEPLAMQILSWIIYAKRELFISELQVALAVRNGDKKLVRGRVTHINIIVRVCAGLITFDEQSKRVRLVHYTLDEYFEQTKKNFFPNADIDIFRVCRNYLSFKYFEKGPCSRSDEIVRRLRRPLYWYAAVNWGYHAQSVSGDDMVLVVAFLENENMMAPSTQTRMPAPRYASHCRDTRRLGSINLASIFGLAGAITLLLRDKPNLLEEKDDFQGWTPLMWAVHSGQKTAVEALLERGPDLEVKTPSGRTPLSRAAFYRREAIAEALLDKGANPETRDKYGRSPLSYAAEKGSVAIARLLLSKKVDIRAKDNASQTPLAWAAGYGHYDIAKLLIHNGNYSLDLDTRDEDGRTALSWAAGNGHESLVRLLLATQRVNPDSRDDCNRSPLFWALKSLADMRRFVRTESKTSESQSGQWDLFELAERTARYKVKKISIFQLEFRELVSLHSRTGKSVVVQWAKDRHTIIQLLLEKGVAVELEDDETGRTPLMLAAEAGEHAIFQMLTDKGADVGSVNGHGQGLLSLADQNYEEQLTELSGVWFPSLGTYEYIDIDE